MRIASLLIFLFTYTAVTAQNYKEVPEKWQKYLYDYKVTLTKVNFNVNDTVVPFTMVQEPGGSLYFIEGHRYTNDTVAFNYYRVWFQLSKEQKDTLLPNVVFIKKDEVLELNDRLTSFSLNNEGIKNTYDFDFQFQQYIHELIYSYIHFKIGLPQLTELEEDTIIRLTNYNFDPRTTNPTILVYEFIPGSKLKQIKKLNYTIDSNHNFILSEEMIIPLIKLEIKNINNTFRSCLEENLNYSTKTKQYNPFLIEFKIGGEYKIIERDEGIHRDIKKYYSEFQSLVLFVNRVGNLSHKQIEKRKNKLNRKE